MHEREMRNAAAALWEATTTFNSTVAEMIIMNQRRITEEKWRRRAGRLRALSHEAVSLAARLRREANRLEVNIFGSDRERLDLEDADNALKETMLCWQVTKPGVTVQIDVDEFGGPTRRLQNHRGFL